MPPSSEDSLSDVPLGAGLREVFERQGSQCGGPGVESVLRAVWQQAGVPFRVSLREPAEEQQPLIRPIAGPTQKLLRAQDSFEVLGEIARGGIGRILRAHDRDLGRDVAMKVLLDEHAGKPAIVHRFIEEAQIGGQLQHPGIVPVYELGLSADERPYFAMKLVKGRTLAALLKERKEPGEDRRRFLGIFEQVCQTIAYAHARGVIHRDLKPSNVMVGAFGEVQVLDWGFAKVLQQGGTADELQTERETVPTQSRASDSVAGAVMGTPAYMPPEQAVGDLEQVDERADVFALGAILCEILTGQPPYVGQVRVQMLLAGQSRLDDAHRRLAECGADAELVAVAKDAMEPDPQSRPRTAEVVAGRITSYLAAVEARAERARIAVAEEQVKTREARKAQRLTVSLAASILITLLVGGGGYLWIQHRESVRRAEVTRELQTALQEGERLFGQAKFAAPDDLVPWTQALGAADRAKELSHSADVEPELRARACSLADSVSMGASKARRRAADDRDDRTMVALLEEILSPNPFHAVPKTLSKQERERECQRRWRSEAEHQDRAYRETFRQYGIDVENQQPESVAEAIRKRRIAMELTVALDDWSKVLSNLPERAGARTRLTQIAKAADPDEWRNRLRDLSLAKEKSRDDLKELLARDLSTLPHPTMCQFARHLWFEESTRQEGEALLRRAWRLHPEDFRINYQMGTVLADELRSSPRWSEAIGFLRAALALRPSNRRVLEFLGYAFERSGDYQSAVATYTDAIKSEPSCGRLHFRLGTCLMEVKNPKEAVAAFREATRLEPDDSFAHWELGRALLEAGDPESVIPAYQKAIELDSTRASLYQGLSVPLTEVGDQQGAITAILEALKLDPDHVRPHVHVNLAIKLQEKGELEAAIAECRTAILLAPDFPNGYVELGDSLLAEGDCEAAIAEYRTAIRLDPDLWQAHYNLFRAFSEQGNLDNAESAVRKAVSLQSDSVRPWDGLGGVLMEKGRFAEALDALERGHDLSSRLSNREDPMLAQRARACRYWAAQEPALLAIIHGESKAAGMQQALDAAEFASCRSMHVRAARLYSDAFAARPSPQNDKRKLYRYRAARAAALAGTNMGEYGAELPEADRAHWRDQALVWLRGELAAWTRRLSRMGDQLRREGRKTLLNWQQHKDLAGVRDEAALARLPAEEQESWRAFWSEVQALLRSTVQEQKK